MRLIAGLVALCLSAGLVLAETKFSLDGRNTTIEFTGTKPDGSHDGGFKTVKGTAAATGSDPTTLAIKVNIDTTSLYSDNPKLTGHLKSADFFNVKKYPTAAFTSKKIAKAKKGYTVTGDLTLLGKTKSVSFPADITVSDKKLTLTADAKINRQDFGMSYGKGKVDDDVKLKIKVSASAK
jgi:polyisoprenoid-binding protein YceI